MSQRDEYELAIARLFRAKWTSEGWDMVDHRELIALAEEVGLPIPLAERVLDQLDRNGSIHRDGHHFRGGMNMVLKLEQDVDRALFYESNVARRELLERAAAALDAGEEVVFDPDPAKSYTTRPWNEARFAAKVTEAVGWGELDEFMGKHFRFQITADGYDLVRSADELAARLPVTANEDREALAAEVADIETHPHESPDDRRPDEPGVFISYSHRDGEFVAALVAELRKENLRIWIDRVELAVGDSLVHSISSAILAQDFVVAVVSRHSVASGWCQKEIALAVTQGINNKQVFVLPVRLGEVEMPASLVDVKYAAGDANGDVTGVAAELVGSIETHLRRRRAVPRD